MCGCRGGRSTDMNRRRTRRSSPYIKTQNPNGFCFVEPSTNGNGRGWDSPWGRGRRAGISKCSALWRRNCCGKEPLRPGPVCPEGCEKPAPRFLTLHGGGLDLQFPHQRGRNSPKAAAPTANRSKWRLLAAKTTRSCSRGQEESKSLGKTSLTVRDLLEQGRARAK